MNTYVRPFANDIKSLFADGIDWKDTNGCVHNTKCILTMCICDSVARPLVQNSKQFNGQYGCGMCMHEGKHVVKGRGFVFVLVYPVEVPLPPMRNCTSTLQHAEIAVRTGEAQFGVKSPSILKEVPHFDVIMGVPPDWMHGVCLGVVRQVVGLCLDSRQGTPFYLGDSID